VNYTQKELINHDIFPGKHRIYQLVNNNKI